VAEEAEPHLALILALLDQGPQAPVLKDRSARKVWTAASPAGPLLIKQFRYPRLENRILRKVRGSRAFREWRNQYTLLDRGAQVPRPLLYAAGEGQGGVPTDYLVMEYLDKARSVHELVHSGKLPSGAARREILKAMGISLARFHHAGGWHGDPHLGNLLLDESKQSPRILVIDLYEASLGRSVAWRQRLKDLGGFLGGLSSWFRTVDKQIILRAYLGTLDDWNPPFPALREAARSMGRAVEFYAARSYRRMWRSRIAKCQEESNLFTRLDLGGYRGWVRRSWDTPGLRETLRDPNACLESPNARVVKHTGTTTVARLDIRDLPGPLFIKRYNRKDAWERTKNLFRRSRGMRVWRHSFALEMLGIPTPQTVCVLEKRRGPLLLENCIVTRWTDGGTGLDDFFREHYLNKSWSEEQRHEAGLIERRVIQLFQELHGHRISHGDLKARNIIAAPDEPPPFNPEFVDLDPMTLRPWRFRRERVNDLARFLYSLYPPQYRSRQIRIFLRYARLFPDVWRQRHRWWARILRRMKKKMQGAKRIEP
jgi:tRNA A-37 threonylcarbamoyl transferase component Bud32